MVFGYLPKRLAFLRRVDASEPHAMLYAVGSQDCWGVAVGDGDHAAHDPICSRGYGNEDQAQEVKCRPFSHECTF
jgi:hypothetical protein